MSVTTQNSTSFVAAASWALEVRALPKFQKKPKAVSGYTVLLLQLHVLTLIFIILFE